MERQNFLGNFLNEEIYHIREQVAETNQPPKVSPQVSQPLKENRKEPDLPKISFEGSISKKVLVMLRNQDWQTSNQAFLEKVLQSIGLTLQEIALVKITEATLTADQIKHIPADKIIAFGLSLRFGETEVAKNTISTEGNVVVISTVSLDQLQQDVSSKKLLWKHLKQVFNV